MIHERLRECPQARFGYMKSMVEMVPVIFRRTWSSNMRVVVDLVVHAWCVCVGCACVVWTCVHVWTDTATVPRWEAFKKKPNKVVRWELMDARHRRRWKTSTSRGGATIYHRGQPTPTIFMNSNEKILYIVLIVPNDPSIFKEDPDGLLA
jgi:hypothetical protein